MTNRCKFLKDHTCGSHDGKMKWPRKNSPAMENQSSFAHSALNQLKKVQILRSDLTLKPSYFDIFLPYRRPLVLEIVKNNGYTIDFPQFFQC